MSHRLRRPVGKDLALLGALALFLLGPLAGARPRPLAAQQPSLAQAERLIDQQQYQAALSLLEQLAQDEALPWRGRFLRGYAQFKLERWEDARQTLERVLLERFTSEAGLLAGMVALEQQRYEEATGLLQRVIAAEESPWRESAQQLLGRVEQARLARERRFTETLSRAQALLEQRQLAQAAQLLDQAEALAPGRLLVRYYRGYLAYQRQDYPAASRQLRAALALEPRDEWSRYMLALVLRDSGQAAQARPLLRELVGSAAEAQVKQVAQQALEGLRRSSTPADRGARLSLQLSAGLGLDTNPTFIEERPAAIEEAGLALQLRGRLYYQGKLGREVRAGLGLAVAERAYAVGGEDAEQTSLGGWGKLVWQPGQLQLGLSYGYALYLLGHQALLSQHTGELELKLALRQRLSLLLAGLLCYRDVHDPRYTYLQAVQGRGAGGAALQAGPLELQLSYLVFKDWAGSVQVPLTLSGASGRSSHGMPMPVDYTLEADYSMVAHGPALQLGLELPWRLRLNGALGLQRRSYQGPDLLVREETGITTSLSAREDWYLAAEAELERPLAHGVSLALRYESLDNVSSQNDPELGFQRSYSQRLAGALVRWRWPDR